MFSNYSGGVNVNSRKPTVFSYFGIFFRDISCDVTVTNITEATLLLGLYVYLVVPLLSYFVVHCMVFEEGSYLIELNNIDDSR